MLIWKLNILIQWTLVYHIPHLKLFNTKTNKRTGHFKVKCFILIKTFYIFSFQIAYGNPTHNGHRKPYNMNFQQFFYHRFTFCNKSCTWSWWEHYLKKRNEDTTVINTLSNKLNEISYKNQTTQPRMQDNIFFFEKLVTSTAIINLGRKREEPSMTLSGWYDLRPSEIESSIHQADGNWWCGLVCSTMHLQEIEPKRGLDFSGLSIWCGRRSGRLIRLHCSYRYARVVVVKRDRYFINKYEKNARGEAEMQKEVFFIDGFYALESRVWKRASYCVCVLRNHSFNVKNRFVRFL